MSIVKALTYTDYRVKGEVLHGTRAAGVNDEYALVRVDPVLLEWADEIVCVERSVFLDLQYHWNDLTKDKKIVVMNIPDQYEWNNPTLRAFIKKQYDDVTSMESCCA